MAIRKLVWYRALDPLERGILTLASRIIDEVRDSALGVELLKIIAKLKDATDSEFARHVYAFGVLQAKMISGYARDFGNQAAASWALDTGFARYLGFLDFNQVTGWSSINRSH
jgi:hypothetical protein